MTKNQKLTYLVLFIFVAAIFFYEYRKFQNNITPLETDTGIATTAASAAAAAGSGLLASPTANSATTLSAAGAAAKPFATWFADETKSLDNKVMDQNEKEAELKDRASRFTAEEISFLIKTSTNSKATANERIEATYLLTLSLSTPALIEVAKTPLSLSSPQPVHSVGETLLMQEKAIRIMAIDELFNRVKDNAALRPSLLQAINQIQDEAVKRYALKRYKELK